MMIVLAVFAVVCLAVIVWATPGVWAQHRRDVRWRRLDREWLRMMAAFEGLNRTAQEAVDTIERLADLMSRTPVWAEEGEAEWVS